MLVFVEELYDVPRHRYVEGACYVIPLQFYPAVEIALPVFGDFVFFLDAVDEVSGMFFSDIFDPEIVDD